MRILKESLGTPLKETGLLDDWHLKKLRAVSITTVEGLLGLIAADPDVIPSFLEVSNLAQLQADAAPRASAAIMGVQDRLGGRKYAMGSRRPPSIEPEDRADPATFDDFLSTYEEGYLAGTPDEGINLLAGFGPVRDQANRGTCVAQAGCAVLEYHHQMDRDSQIDHSEQFLYWKAKQTDGHPESGGTWLEVAMPIMVDTGVCVEQVWPYNPDPIPGNESQGPPPSSAEADAHYHRAQGHQQLNHRASVEIRGILDGGRPVAISVPVFRNWYGNPNTNALGLIPMPLPTSVLEGGHAMCAVGYDYDDEFAGGGYFILRNSWGLDWAPLSPIQAGYGVIPFSYIDLYGWEAFALA
jgi:hypothetical protein